MNYQLAYLDYKHNNKNCCYFMNCDLKNDQKELLLVKGLLLSFANMSL